MKNEKENRTGRYEISFGKEAIVFTKSSASHQICVHSGYRLLSTKFFKGEVPQDAEVEMSLYFVEKQWAVQKNKLSGVSALATSDQIIGEMFGLSKEGFIRIEDVERLNFTFADYLVGMPASQLQIDFSKQKFAIALLLRKVMYLLKIKEISFYRNT